MFDTRCIQRFYWLFLLLKTVWGQLSVNGLKENGGRLLTIDEVERIVNELAEHPMQKPYLNDTRTKMASRDFSFRDAYHGNIADYLQAVTPEEFERFIGDQSIDFDRILADNKDVLKRLKQAEDE